MTPQNYGMVDSVFNYSAHIKKRRLEKAAVFFIASLFFSVVSGSVALASVEQCNAAHNAEEIDEHDGCGYNYRCSDWNFSTTYPDQNPCAWWRPGQWRIACDDKYCGYGWYSKRVTCYIPDANCGCVPDAPLVCTEAQCGQTLTEARCGTQLQCPACHGAAVMAVRCNATTVHRIKGVAHTDSKASELRIRIWSDVYSIPLVDTGSPRASCARYRDSKGGAVLALEICGGASGPCA